MTKINVKCPVCRQRGQLAPHEIGGEHECFNCHQTVRLVPEPSHIRTLKTVLVAIPLVLLILWALGIILDKLSP